MSRGKGNKQISALFSRFNLQRRLNLENAYAWVKKLRILLRLNLDNKKSLATALGALCLAVLLWGMSTVRVSAQGAIQAGIGAISNAAVAYGIYAAGAYILMSVLSWLLGIVGALLDYAFLMNSYINPGQLIIVQRGWTYMRDLANGIFILLVLWIAITIVFNLEGLGGKRLLVRVIMVALLINFSLVMVSMVFAFGNELAKPFARAMGLQVCSEQKGAGGKITTVCPPPKATISALIMNNGHIQDTTRIFTDKGALEAFEQAQKALQNPKVVESENRFGSIAEYLGAPQTAHAQWGLACLGVGGISAGVGGAICYALASIAIPIVIGAIFHATGADIGILKAIFNMIVANGFLFLTMMAMLTAAVILFLRLVAMVFLGVSAPIAFLGIAFPKYGEKFWSKWLDQLFRWAATAPIFYFLLYLALLMLQTNSIDAGSASGGADVPLMANIYRIISLVLFLVFLWAAVYMTKKTAGHFADVALSVGRKGLGFGLGVATGFVARRALPKLGQMAEKGGAAIGKVENPFLRGMLRTPAKILRRTATAGRKQVLEAQGRVGSMTSSEIQRAIGAGEFGEADLAGAMSVLQSRGQITAMPNIKNYGEAQQLAGKNTLRKLGLDFNGFLRANPMLARQEDFSKDDIDTEIREGSAKLGRTIDGTEAAQRLTWSKKVRSENMRTMDLDILENPRAIEQLLEFGSGDHLRELMRFNSAAAGKVQNHLDANPTLYANIVNEKVKKYLENNTAQSFGWRPPPGAVPPPTPVSIGATRPPRWTSGVHGTFTPTVSGGTGPYIWRFAAGSPPPPAWLTINPNTGEISGTPPGSVRQSVSIEVEDTSTGTVSPAQTFTITS